MKIHFVIEYTDKNNDQVETFSSIELNDDGRKVLHELLDEYLNNNTNWNATHSDHSDNENGFRVRLECKCNNS